MLVGHLWGLTSKLEGGGKKLAFLKKATGCGSLCKRLDFSLSLDSLSLSSVVVVVLGQAATLDRAGTCQMCDVANEQRLIRPTQAAWCLNFIDLI